MIRLLVLTLALLILSIATWAQESDNKRPQGTPNNIGFGADPDVSPRKCKIYYGYRDTLMIGLQTEGGEWVSYYMTKGVSDISLQDCGLGKDRVCEKVFRICTSGKAVCEAITLEGKSRYEIVWLKRKKKWSIRKR